MLLVALLRRRRGELEADFRQYYGLDLGGMGRDYTVLHAATLAAHLPLGSRTVAAEGGEDAVGAVERLLALIEYDLRVLDYHFVSANVEKKDRGKLAEPEPPLFTKQYADRHRRGMAMSIEDLNKILGI